MKQDLPKIIDSHIHLFDSTRKQGIPWPNPDDEIYKPHLAADFQKIAEPLGVVSAIAVEASPWLEDNDWLLEHVEQSDYFLGCVGNLDLGNPEFEKHFERLSQSPKYLGIRSGNLWDYDFTDLITRPQVINHLQLMAVAQKTLDLANPNLDLLQAVIQVKEQVPELKVVIDHLPNIRFRESEIGKFKQQLKELNELPDVFIKFSEIAQYSQENDRFNLKYYQVCLDRLWDTFGSQKILFGSDYPNSEFLGNISSIFKLVEDYLQSKTEIEKANIWWQNVFNAYTLPLHMKTWIAEEK